MSLTFSRYGINSMVSYLSSPWVLRLDHSLGYPRRNLKSYADPKSNEQRDVEASTVTDHFYAWLSKWTGPGQLVILENQEMKGNSKAALNPLEFVGDSDDEGPRGFYPEVPNDISQVL